MSDTSERVAQARRRFARQMARASGCDDPRLREAFQAVPREDFLPPAPWRIVGLDGFGDQETSDPAALYRNVLVSLDRDKGINNGEPFLHAAWLGAVLPQSGETVCHVGVGHGYYTAILARLVAPGGQVLAIELDPDLARAATQALAAYPQVRVVCADATRTALPPCDLLYVNAGVSAPPLAWLEALRRRGRLIMPWRPAPDVGLAIIVTRIAGGFAVKVLMPSWFIPCVGASAASGEGPAPTPHKAATIRSLWRRADCEPDDSAVAVYPDLWFSSTAIA